MALTTACQIIPPHDLSAVQRDAMWSLFDATYTGITRDVFERDLNDKTQVFLLTSSGRLAGFTSQKKVMVDCALAIYSGDTVVAPEARGYGTTALYRAWSRQALGRADWWCALSSGSRTFRILTLFYARVTPGPFAAETPTEAKWRHRLAQAEYGSNYHAADGIVRLADPYRLRDAQATRAHDPATAFFLAANPQWAQGDELVSLVRMNESNLTAAGRRMWEVQA